MIIFATEIQTRKIIFYNEKDKQISLGCHPLQRPFDDIGIDEQLDNPVTEPEQASAEDPGRWWIDESHMDKSVNPGDNFYMYCIGTWWKNTPLPTNVDYVDYFTNVKPTFKERVNSLTDANYQKFLSDLKWAEEGSEAAIAGQRLYDDVLAKSGLEAATTKEARPNVCNGREPSRLDRAFLHGWQGLLVRQI